MKYQIFSLFIVFSGYASSQETTTKAISYDDLGRVVQVESSERKLIQEWSETSNLTAIIYGSDSDGSGIPNIFESKYGLSAKFLTFALGDTAPLSVSFAYLAGLPLSDLDNDERLLINEYLFNMNAFSGNSAVSITQMSPEGFPRVEWYIRNDSYWKGTYERSTDLKNWIGFDFTHDSINRGVVDQMVGQTSSVENDYIKTSFWDIYPLLHNSDNYFIRINAKRK